MQSLQKENHREISPWSALVNQKLAQSQVGRSLPGTGAAETHKTTVIVKHERAEAETKSGGWSAYATKLKL